MWANRVRPSRSRKNEGFSVVHYESVKGAVRGLDNSFITLDQIQDVHTPRAFMRSRPRKPMPARFNRLFLVKDCDLFCPSIALSYLDEAVDEFAFYPLGVAVPLD